MQAGIDLSADKKTMLELRIKRRLRSLNLNSYAQYCDYLFAHHGQKEEIVHLIDVVTTNKTDFFREAGHFEFLVAEGNSGRLGAQCKREAIAGLERRLLHRRGALYPGHGLNDYGLAHPGFRFRVLATDISTTVLAKAKLGVYSYEVVRPVPHDMQRRYFMRSRDPDSKVMRVVPELRQLVEFRRLNFMDSDFGLSEKADIIFCRNALIYFDRPTQEQILQKLTRHLVPAGYLFVGHAETLHDMDIPLAPVAPALYRKADAGS